MANQQTLNPEETVVEELSDGTRLLELPDGAGAVVEKYGAPDAADGVEYWRVEYQDYRDARLHAGLWLRVDGFDRPDRSSDKFVPLDVATEGRETLAAWLMTSGGSGIKGSREVVADRLDVTVDTVSRYLSKVRAEIEPRPEDRIITDNEEDPAHD